MKPIITSGKRKTAVARAVLTLGTGRVTINSVALQSVTADFIRMKALEPLTIAGAAAKEVNIAVRIAGGGATSQADAARLAISRALVEHDGRLEQAFNAYDRQLLVADVRRKEVHKPDHHGKARAKKQTSYR